MVVLIPLTFLILFLIQMLDGIRSIGQSILRAAVILGGLIVLATETLSLAGMLDGPRLSIFWAGSLLVALGWLARQLRGGHRLPVLHRVKPASPAEVVLPLLALLLVGGTFCVALISPVQTYDSLSYHLSRVAHWAQNRSVAVYVTGIERQNMMGPFAEYAILHLYVLQGGDRLANLVDWSAYLGCAIAAATIAAGLGAGRLGRLLAAVSAASLPMAVAQASSSMTDIVVAFWSLCAIAEVVASKAGREADWRHWLYLAGSVGLAVLTKSTAAAFVLPFLLWFGINALLAGGLRLTAARLLAFLALVGALNGAFWLRNAQTYGTPLGSPELLRLHANQVLTPGVLVSNLVRNLSLNFGTPFPQVNEFTTSVLAKLHSLAGMNIEDPRTTYNGNFSITDQVMMEDRVGNPIHLLMLAAAGLGVLVGRRSTRLARGYALLAAATLALFSLGNTYQVFGNRLLVPFFLLSLPLIGLLAERWRPWVAAGAGVLLFLAGLPWLLSLQSRPLIPLDGQTIPMSILNMDRQDLYFANVGGLPAEQYRVVEQIRIASCADIGLMLAGDDPEYLWWVLLGAPDDRLRIEWLVSGTPSEQFSDPDFQPCAVICTSCPQEWQSIGDLPLQEQSAGLRLFLREGP